MNGSRIDEEFSAQHRHPGAASVALRRAKGGEPPGWRVSAPVVNLSEAVVWKHPLHGQVYLHAAQREPRRSPKRASKGAELASAAAQLRVEARNSQSWRGFSPSSFWRSRSWDPADGLHASRRTAQSSPRGEARREVSLQKKGARPLKAERRRTFSREEVHLGIPRVTAELGLDCIHDDHGVSAGLLRRVVYAVLSAQQTDDASSKAPHALKAAQSRLSANSPTPTTTSRSCTALRCWEAVCALTLFAASTTCTCCCDSSSSTVSAPRDT